MELRIVEVIGDVVWMGIYQDNNLYFKEPLAAAIRRYLEPQYNQDVANDDKFRTETAFAKLALGESIKKELRRA